MKAKDCDLVLGAEARGFILGAAIAVEAGVGFVPARRPGKLPPGDGQRDATCSSTAQNSLELHPDLIPKGSRVVIHDDVLATGGTVEAINGLVEQLGGDRRRRVLHHRADVPRRPRAARRLRSARADRVLRRQADHQYRVRCVR